MREEQQPPDRRCTPLGKAAGQAFLEAGLACEKSPSFHSGHEAYAVILEELDEFWIEVKANRYATCRAELMQVVAMCLRAMAELYPDPEEPVS